MKKQLRHVLLGALCGATTVGGLPAEVLAGPMSAAPPETVGLTAPIESVHYYRRYYRPVYRVGYHRRYAYYPRRVYYRHPRRYYYGYDPSGAIFASAALGLMGAGIAAATAPRWGYGGWGYGGWGGGGWGWGGGWGPGWGYGGWGPGWGWGGGWW